MIKFDTKPIYKNFIKSKEYTSSEDDKQMWD